MTPNITFLSFFSLIYKKRKRIKKIYLYYPCVIASTNTRIDDLIILLQLITKNYPIYPFSPCACFYPKMRMTGQGLVRIVKLCCRCKGNPNTCRKKRIKREMTLAYCFDCCTRPTRYHLTWILHPFIFKKHGCSCFLTWWKGLTGI